MPESNSEQALRQSIELLNFLNYGDARGEGWLASHPGDLEKARQRLHIESTKVSEPDFR